MRENTIRIGRKQENDIVIADEFMSGFHAILLVSADGSYRLKDAGSSNGTFIKRQGQAQPVSGTEQVWPHEEVVLGSYRLTVSQLLSYAPPHLANPPAYNQNADFEQSKTRPIQPPVHNAPQGSAKFPSLQQQRDLPLAPEQVAAGSLGKPQQQGVGRVAMGSPVPSEERVIWSGYSSLAYWLLGMLWSGLWIIIWLIVAIVVALPFLVLSIIATLGLIKKLLLYINTYYEFTSQRVRRREGVLTLRRNQIELFRLKDFEVVETLWGRIFNYSHIRLISSERIMPNVLFLAVPNGAKLAEAMRKLAQINRAESGIMHLKE